MDANHAASSKLRQGELWPNDGTIVLSTLEDRVTRREDHDSDQATSKRQTRVYEHLTNTTYLPFYLPTWYSTWKQIIEG